MVKRGYLQFECGARSVTFDLSEATRDFETFSLMESKRRKKDGRYPIIVFDSYGYEHKPTFEDGRVAPCLSCPCRRRAGYRQFEAMPEMGRGFRVFVTCYPQEVYEADSSAVEQTGLGDATPDVADATRDVAL